MPPCGAATEENQQKGGAIVQVAVESRFCLTQFRMWADSDEVQGLLYKCCPCVILCRVNYLDIGLFRKKLMAHTVKKTWKSNKQWY